MGRPAAIKMACPEDRPLIRANPNKNRKNRIHGIRSFRNSIFTDLPNHHRQIPENPKFLYFGFEYSSPNCEIPSQTTKAATNPSLKSEDNMTDENTSTAGCGEPDPNRSVFGIDLGTTFSAIAVHTPAGPVVVDLFNNQRSVASIVSVKGPDSFKVGTPNDAFYAKNPSSVITNAKRLVGRSFAQIEKKVEFWPFKVVADDDGAAVVKVGKKTYKPEFLLSKILCELVRKGQEYVAEKDNAVLEAVICVPAKYDSVQKHCTKSAAEQAGIKVLATINEPTAAALAAFPSPCLPDGQSRVVVIYDFGGGTFDVSVIRISKMSEAGGFRYRVLSTEGDAYLGGIDIDKEIALWAEDAEDDDEVKSLNDSFEVLVEDLDESDFENTKAEKVGKNTGKVDQMGGAPSTSEHQQNRFEFMAELMRACEKAKIELGGDSDVNIFVKDYYGRGKPLDVELSIERFNKLASKFVDTSISLVRQAILSAENELKQSEELGKDEVLIVHDIIPVGGTSHLHIVKTKLEAAFPSVRVVASQDREFSVAKGAAIWAANLGMYNEVQITDVVTHNIGIAGADGRMCVIIPKNTVLPSSGNCLCAPLSATQPDMKIVVYEGPHKMAINNRFIGHVVYELTDQTKYATAQLTVDYDGRIDVMIDADNRAQVVAHFEISNGPATTFASPSVKEFDEDQMFVRNQFLVQFRCDVETIRTNMVEEMRHRGAETVMLDFFYEWEEVILKALSYISAQEEYHSKEELHPIEVLKRKHGQLIAQWANASKQLRETKN